MHKNLDFKMAVASPLVQNANVKNEDDIEKFPYRIFNDLSKKLKDAEVTIAKMLAEREALEDVKDDEINILKQKISDLTYENNRYVSPLDIKLYFLCLR